MSEGSTNPHLYALVACELSADTLGAGLMKAILRHDPQAQFIGIGGPKMAKYGLKSAFPQEELAVMGIFEVIAHMLPILKIRRAITKMLLKARPVVMIGIDAPDFNLHIEHRLKIAGIKTIHYVSPSVWAWRENRIKKIKAACDEVLALLPFEKEFYDRHDMPCTYVGHTLANTIPLDIDQNAARERIGLYKNCVDSISGKVLAILPGSRRGIITRMLPLYAQTARLIRQQIKDVNFISVAPSHEIALLIKDLWLEYAPEISITVFVGNQQDTIASADVCLLTCGTIAFEAMLLKRPMVVAYKVSALSACIARRLLKVDMYSLPNLLAKRTIVPELIQEFCTPEKLTFECIRLLSSDNLLMKKEFATIHERIRTNADELAVKAVMRVIATPSAQELKAQAKREAAAERAANKAAKAADAASAATTAAADSAADAATAGAASDAAETVGAASAQSPQTKSHEGYREFKQRTHKAEVEHRDSDSVVSASVVMDTAKTYKESLNTEEVPLRQGLDDQTVKRLSEEVKHMEPQLTLEDVLHMPNPDAKSTKRKTGQAKPSLNTPQPKRGTGAKASTVKPAPAVGVGAGSSEPKANKRRGGAKSAKGTRAERV